MNCLRISDNRRFLVFEDGSPFFWLGDTAWELFHRLTLEEMEYYFENRRQKGFTVIQAVVLAEFDGLHTPNAYGDIPLFGDDPLRPNEAYFAFVDRVIDLACRKGLFIGLLPTWGDKIELLAHGKGPVIFNPENARLYGEWIGCRYRDKPNLVWINGGDRSGGAENFAVWDALARGIKSADPTHLMTFHPMGGGDGHSSSEWFHACDWLDFNLAQSGHSRKNLPNYEIVSHDYHLTPVKPCLDGEPRYEDHAVNWKPQELGWFDDYDVRQAAYWALFAGAFGHTYGCHAVWQMYAAGRDPITFARRPWKQALDLPGAQQMTHARNLLLSRPFLTRVPDASLAVPARAAEGVHLAGTRDESGSYGMVYGSARHKFKVSLKRLSGTSVRAWWFNPLSGQATLIGEFPNNGEREFTPSGESPDWVLILDDAAKGYAPPASNDPFHENHPQASHWQVQSTYPRSAQYARARKKQIPITSYQ